MITISLNKGKSARISQEDIRLCKYEWKAVFTKGKWYAYRVENGKTVYMHREVMGFPREVDHIDGNGLHNERGNLREARHSENIKNMNLSKANTTGYKGVSVSLEKRKFVAQIMVDGKHMFLGYFEDPRNAAMVYDEAARKHFGNFAKTNADLGLL